MISIITDPEKWDAAAETSYYPYVSYKFGWLRSIGLSFPHLRPLPLAKVDKEGAIEYICPCFIDKKGKEIVSSAFLAPGFINKNTNPDEMVQKIIEYAKKENCEKISFQLPPNFNYVENLLDKGFKLIRKICFFCIDISGIVSFDSYLSDHLSERKKTYYKAARKRGIEVEILFPSEEALDRFYPFYIEMCQRKSAARFEKYFIASLTQSLKETARYWIAILEGRDIGSALTFEFRNRIWLWLVQANRNIGNYQVDSFLYAEIIRHSFEKNIKIFDLGTSPLEGSLGNFKRLFGAKPVFHELYELDLSLFGIVKRGYIDLKRVIKNKWLTGRPD